MVTRQLNRARSIARLVLFGVALSGVSCRAALEVGRPEPIIEAHDPEEARRLALATKDPLLESELAWLEANDRALARRRLEAALAKHPHDPALLIRSAMLRGQSLDEAGALEDILTMIEHAPSAPETDVALVLLADTLGDHLAQRERILSALLGSNLLGDRPEEPMRVMTASSIASRLAALGRDLERMRALVARGGWLTRFRAIGPLGPKNLSVFSASTPEEETGIDPERKTSFMGLVLPVRELTAFRTSVSPAAGDRSGLYVMESYVEVGPGAATGPVRFFAQLGEPGRVRIDGTKIFESQLGGPREPGQARIDLDLEPGWHRVTVVLLASSGTRPALAMLDQAGRPIITSMRATLGEAKLATRAPVVRRTSDADPHGTAEAWVDGLLANKTHGLFACLVGVQLASTGIREHIDLAERLSTLALEAAPRSAALLSADARLMARTGVPRSLAQARLREALALDPTNAALLVALARSVSDDAPDLALSLLDRAEKEAPRSAAPHIARFRLEQGRGFNAEAATSLEQALSRRETEALLSEGASFYRGLARIDEALALEARLEAITEPSPGAARATRLLRLGDVDGAIVALREAASTSTHPAVHLARIASLELTRGNTEAARKVAEEALAADPLNGAALRTHFLTSLATKDEAKTNQDLAQLRGNSGADVRLEALLHSISRRAPLDAPFKGTWLGQRLAIDSRAIVTGTRDSDLRWSAHKSVRLLERVVDEVRPDGSALSLRHAITRLLTKEATDDAGEFSLPNGAVPIALRTIKADGRIIEVDRHAGKDDLSFSALAPGDAVEQSWVSVEEPETNRGGYARRFFFKNAVPLLRVEYAVAVPKHARVWYQSYNGAPEPEVREEGDVILYLFSAKDVPPVEPEPNGAPWEEHLPFVVLTVDLDRDAALSANLTGIETLGQTSWRIQHQAEQLTRGLTTEEQKIRALHAFVSEAIGQGGAIDPSIVLATRRGDRTGLFVAMLRAIGIDAQLVLARPGAAPRVTPAYPNPQRYGTTLVRIPLSGQTDPLWGRMDLPTPWLGKATPDFREGTYVVAKDEHSRKDTTFRESEVERWTLRSNVDLAIDENGAARGSVELTLPGTYGSELRTFLKSTRLEDVSRALETWISSLIPGTRLEGWKAEGVERPLEPLVIRAKVSVVSFMVEEKRHLVAEQFFNTPLATRALGFPTLSAYLRVPRRMTPMMLAELEEEMTVTVALPKTSGAPLEGPRTVKENAPWGSFSQAFIWDAVARRGKLSVTQKIPTMRIAPNDFPAFRDGVQQILQATRNRLIVPLESKNDKEARSVTSTAFESSAPGR